MQLDIRYDAFIRDHRGQAPGKSSVPDDALTLMLHQHAAAMQSLLVIAFHHRYICHRHLERELPASLQVPPSARSVRWWMMMASSSLAPYLHDYGSTMTVDEYLWLCFLGMCL